MPRALLATLCALASAAALAAASPPGPPPRLVDRVVAVVDDDPILLSDLERVIALGVVAPQPEESEASLRRRVLEGLIEQRLRFHEVDRYGHQQLPVAAIQEQVAAIAGRFADEEDFAARLAELGMSRGDVEQLVVRQLQVLTFVDELLGARVFVGLDEIQRYYEEVLVPRLAAAGESAPPLEQVREQIRSLLREERLNQELQRWTAELRRQADVIDHLDRPQRPLPPVAPR
ncbi:MAG TPA: hypothetical protein VMT16_05695 [Thermoanaerobaculia bacterium]|nr:hypothetical protein [Thermoanaerobaculia bacterium]